MRGRMALAAVASGRVQWKPPKIVGHKETNPSRMSRDARHASPAALGGLRGGGHGAITSHNATSHY